MEDECEKESESDKRRGRVVDSYRISFLSIIFIFAGAGGDKKIGGGP